MKQLSDYDYQAVLSKDKRFDGVFFIGVKTTGIYCRPSCSATPNIENTVLFASSLMAEKEGYRPCLKCQPHLIQLDSSSKLISQALKLLGENKFENLQELAEELKTSSRHLRRLFNKELGQSPKQLLTFYRLNFAWELIKESTLSMTEVAFASGFFSLRSFNNAFKKRFKKTPSSLRRLPASNSPSKEHSYTLFIPYTPPLDWDSLHEYYRRHQVPFLENSQDNQYQRVFIYEEKLGVLKLTHEPKLNRMSLTVHYDEPQRLLQIVSTIRRMFDLNLNPQKVEKQFENLPFFKKLWNCRPGMRIASYWDPFEALICTILGQVVSIPQAVKLAQSLMMQWGKKALHPLTKEPIFLFPTPETLAEANLDELKTTTSRKKAIKELCQQIVNKKLNLTNFYEVDSIRKDLMNVSGVGSWTADYFLLRGLGYPDAFPDKDLVLKRHNQIEKIGDVQLLRPWRSYAAVYLWSSHEFIL